eukprot:573712-Lingulodinium_polyedra.AAC.1
MSGTPLLTMPGASFRTGVRVVACDASSENLARRGVLAQVVCQCCAGRASSPRCGFEVSAVAQQ